MRFFCQSLAAVALIAGAAFAQTSDTSTPRATNRQDLPHRQKAAPGTRISGAKAQIARPKSAAVTETVLNLLPVGEYFMQQLNATNTPSLGNNFWTSVYTSNSIDLANFTTLFGYAPEDLTPFPGAQDIYPEAGATPPVILGPDNVYYGIASGGGTNNEGYIYSFSQSTPFADLYDFTGGADGGYTAGNVILGSDGLLYGTGFIGGNSGTNNSQGTLFSFNRTTKQLTVLWDFCQDFNSNFCTDSANPGGIVEGHDGNIYGVSFNGGGSNAGTLWVYNKSTQQVSVLYSFSGSQTGSNPVPDSGTPIAPPIEISGHTLYGTTTGFNQQEYLGIWSYNIDTQVFTPEWFGEYGSAYSAPLTLASDGNLYATSGVNGAGGNGFFYSYTPGSSVITDLFDFGNSSGNPDGADPTGNVYQGPDALFYTATSGGQGQGELGPGTSALVNLSVSSVTQAPLMINLPSNGYTGQPLTLSFTSNVMFSRTSQQCYAYSIERSNGQLTIYGPLPGSLNSSTGIYTGGGTIPGPGVGVYDVSLVCGAGLLSNSATVTVSTPGTTSLSFSHTRFTSGQAGTETVKVIASDGNSITGGKVSLGCGNVNLGSVSVINGAANFTIPNTAGLPAGSYSCSATYSGTNGYTGSSAQQSITLSNQSTGTTVSSTNDTVNPGDQITLTATITGGNYTPNGGYVTFQTNGVTIGTAQVQSGAASLKTTVPNVQPGTYSVTGFYSGTNTGSASSYGLTNITVQ